MVKDSTTTLCAAMLAAGRTWSGSTSKRQRTCAAVADENAVRTYPHPAGVVDEGRPGELLVLGKVEILARHKPFGQRGEGFRRLRCAEGDIHDRPDLHRYLATFEP